MPSTRTLRLRTTLRSGALSSHNHAKSSNSTADSGEAMIRATEEFVREAEGILLLTEERLHKFTQECILLHKTEQEDAQRKRGTTTLSDLWSMVIGGGKLDFQNDADIEGSVNNYEERLEQAHRHRTLIAQHLSAWRTRVARDLLVLAELIEAPRNHLRANASKKAAASVITNANSDAKNSTKISLQDLQGSMAPAERMQAIPQARVQQVLLENESLLSEYAEIDKSLTYDHLYDI